MCKEKSISMDVDALKHDMKSNLCGTYFVGEFGGALVASFNADGVSSECKVEKTICQGFDLKKYQT